MPPGDSVGQGKKLLGVHGAKVASPCVNQCHLAFLSETSLSHSGTCLKIEGTREPLSLLLLQHSAPRHCGSFSSRAAGSSELLLPCMCLLSPVVGALMVCRRDMAAF